MSELKVTGQSPEGVLASAANVELTPKIGHDSRVLIRYDETAPKSDDDPARDPGCAFTYGTYYVAYAPVSGYNGGAAAIMRSKNPYNVVSDLFGEKRNRRFTSYEGMLRYADQNNDRYAMAIRWMVRNANLTQELFAIARRNLAFRVPFSVDWPRYCRTIGTSSLTPTSLKLEAAEDAHAIFSRLTVDKDKKKEILGK